MDNFNETIKGDKLTVADFFATWCGPCKMQGPVIERLHGKIGDSVNIIKIDVDRQRDLAERYEIRSVPTIIIFKNGEILWRASGLQQLEVLEEKIRNFM